GQPLHHQMYRSNPTAIHSLASIRHLVDNVTGTEHRPGLVLPVLGFEPTLDSVLAVPKDLWIGSVHSKWFFCWLEWFLIERISTNTDSHFELFVSNQITNH